MNDIPTPANDRLRSKRFCWDFVRLSLYNRAENGTRAILVRSKSEKRPKHEGKRLSKVGFSLGAEKFPFEFQTFRDYCPSSVRLAVKGTSTPTTNGQ